MASSWSRPPTSFSEDVVRAQQDRMRRAILIGLRGVVLRTPVGNTSFWKTKHPPKGYVGGRARGNWQVTRDTPASGELQIFDETGDSTVAQGNVAAGPFDVWYLTNNVPYAERLEHGWSQQAPSGMVSVTLAELAERLR